jgi:hypothetical protein
MHSYRDRSLAWVGLLKQCWGLDGPKKTHDIDANHVNMDL